jgi:DNA integrity scanning protein DisA with diadenylate cyclase activity
VGLPGFVFPLLVMGIPVSIAMSVLRYRLYDVDRIISRSVAYAMLTSLLVGGYFLSVLVLQSVLPLPEKSPLIVAASTLVVVAAFGPLRTRIQRIVDRRFNRSRYDAALTIESFGVRLRQEVDLESLTLDLMRVVDTTVRPAHLSLWIKPGINR